MSTRSIEDVVSEYASLQGRLARRFIEIYKPRDLRQFRDVPDGAMELDSTRWEHRRHGVGVRFVSALGAQVNAHVAMAQHPEAFDAGRLVEYLESVGVDSVLDRGAPRPVEFRELTALLDQMAALGLLERRVSPHSSPHPIFELAAPPHA